jgi:hypothetical protein
MFPGTSTIQTRLRYMLFVPWIYQMAGSLRGTLQDRKRRARMLEIQLISALSLQNDQRGVIGREAQEKLKRLPSDVYWAGLRTLGIRRFQGSRDACLEAAATGETGLWAAGLPPVPDGFLSTLDREVTFDLLPEEAGFIRDRLAHEAPRSLFTLLARQDGFNPSETIWEHKDQPTWPADVREIVNHAKLFSHLMHGASLLYNLLLSEKIVTRQGAEGGKWHETVAKYLEGLDHWQMELPQNEIADWDLVGLWQIVGQSTHKLREPTRRFVEDWRNAVLSAPKNIADHIDARSVVEARETRLKGGKSRFTNDAALMRWSGASGTAPLNYRWSPVVSNHLGDLCHAG